MLTAEMTEGEKEIDGDNGQQTAGNGIYGERQKEPQGQTDLE
jgi:hypothetical protein